MKIKMKFFLRLLLSICLLALTSCQKQTTESSTQPNNLGLLEDFPCNAPCWQTITPGITSVDEVKNVLNNSIYVKDYLEEKMDNEVKLIQWVSVTNSLNSISFCKGKVFTLFFQISYKFYLSELLAKYGFPDFVRVREAVPVEELMISFHIYYPAKGITANLLLPLKEVEIKPDSQIQNIVYYNPDFDDCLPGFFEVNDGISWPGYGPINTDN
jgi:hypothetical protein